MELLCGEVETVKGFCYLGHRLNASGGCETAVTSKSKDRMDEIQRMRRVVTWKVFFENERDGTLYLRKISNVVWK